MPLFVTPGQLNKRSDFYHQLASLTAAGMPIIQALESVRRNAPSRSYIRPLDSLVASLQQGSTFAEALARLGNWMSSFDLALFAAGERSGRLDSCLKLLAEYYKEQAQLMSKVISDLAYPFFMIHMAVLVFPITSFTALLLQSQVAPFILQKLSLLVPLYIGILIVLAATQGTRTSAWRKGVEQILGCVPLLGKGRRMLSLSRLSAALEALISAGVSIIDAWPMAAASSGSPALQRAVSRMQSQFPGGVTPSEALQRERVFPELFRSLYNSGEISGQLDSTLLRLRKHYAEEASLKMQNFAQWAPRMVFLVVAVVIGYQVVSFYQNYYGQMMSQF